MAHRLTHQVRNEAHGAGGHARAALFRACVVLALLALVGTLPSTLSFASNESAPRQVAEKKVDEKGSIDINRAGVSELQSLKGIGPSLARRIVAHREQHGPFEKIEDLLAIKGVGPKLLDRIRTKIVVKAAPKSAS